MGDEAPAGREFSGAPPAGPADAHRQDSRLDAATHPERRFVPPAAWRSPGGVVRRGRGPRPRDGDLDRATRQADPARSDRRRYRGRAFGDWLAALVAPGAVIEPSFGVILDSDIAFVIGLLLEPPDKPGVHTRAIRRQPIAELLAITSPDIERWAEPDTRTPPFLRTYTYDYAEPGALSLTVAVTPAHALTDTEPIANRNT